MNIDPSVFDYISTLSNFPNNVEEKSSADIESIRKMYEKIKNLSDEKHITVDQHGNVSDDYTFQDFVKKINSKVQFEKEKHG